MKEIINNIINKVHPEKPLLRISNFLGHCFYKKRYESGRLPYKDLTGETLNNNTSGRTAFLGVRAFTLIELLVVVLIIGILAAIALPQYQKAVEKARLATWMPLVRAIYDAEETHYLATGTYTTDLEVLSIQIPVTDNCQYRKNDTEGYYICNGNYVGVFNNTAQYHNDNIAYMHYFMDIDGDIPRKKGEIWCFAKTEKYFNICKSLGTGTEFEGNAWKYQWRLN